MWQLLLALAAAAYAVLVLPGSVTRLLEEIAAAGLRGTLGDLLLLAVVPTVFGVGGLVAAGLAGGLAGGPAGGHDGVHEGRRSLLAGAGGGLACAVALGLGFGAWRVVANLRANQYARDELWSLALDLSDLILRRFLLVSLAAGVLAIVVVAALRLAAGGGERLSASAWIWLLPTGAAIGLGLLWTERSWITGLEETLSLTVPLAWSAVCLVAGWFSRRALAGLAGAAGRGAPKILGAPLLVVGLVALLGLALAPRTVASRGPDRPNLVLISLDTLRADHLGVYGYERPTSPNLDAFARGGLVVKRAYVPSPWTLPSHGTMLTGVYPSRHGGVTKFNRIGAEFPMISEVLRNVGYRVLGVTDGGFLSREYGYDGFEVFDDRSDHNGDVVGRVGRAMQLLREEDPRPFFLFLHTYEVHCPYEPPAEYDVFSDPGYDGIVHVEGECVQYYRDLADRLEERDYQHVASKYDGEILFTDAVIGRFLDFLGDSGLLENTVVAITSDHGENFGDHPEYQLGHSELYDHTLRVPLILRGPGIPAGQVFEGPVEGTDLVPTLLDLVGVASRGELDGRSFRPALDGGPWKKPYLFGEKFPTMRMVRSNEWKLIHREASDFELYDLLEDPGEHHSLVGSRPEVEPRLREILREWGELQDRRVDELSTGQDEVPDRLKEKLEALGYVG